MSSIIKKMLNFFRKRKILKKLRKTEYAPELTLETQFLPCKVVGVYDGDTITIMFPFHKKLYQKKLRLLEIDTPEIRTRNAIEKKAGFMVRDWLKKEILDKIVWVQFGDWDKFGRLTGLIYHDENKNICVNSKMVKMGYATVYDGGRKKEFHEWWNVKLK